MVNSILSSPQEIIMQNALSGAALRHKVLSNNIANVNTPGFKRTEVSFEDRLSEAMQQETSSLAQTNARHIPGRKTGGFAPLMNVEASTTMRVDGNNVDIDAEMANVAKNNIYYDAVAQMLSRYYSNLQSVINGGGR